MLLFKVLSYIHFYIGKKRRHIPREERTILLLTREECRSHS